LQQGWTGAKCSYNLSRGSLLGYGAPWRARPARWVGLTLWVLAALRMLHPVPLLAEEAAAGASDASQAKLLSPPLRDGKPVEIKLGLYVTNLAEVDEVRERFRINGYLSEIWQDSRLAFKLQGAGEQMKRVHSGQIWIPDLLMINSVSPRRRISVNIKVAPDGTVYYLEEFQAELSTQYELKTFPFDRQSLQIVIQPFLDERETVTFAADPKRTGVSPEPWVPLAQWEILGVTGTAERTVLPIAQNRIAEFEFNLAIKRRYWFYLWKIFLPLMLMVVVSYCAFWIKLSDQYTQLTIALTAILTEIAFLFAISSSLPRIPYLTYIDAFFLLTLFFSFVSMIELVIVHQAVEQEHFVRAQRIRRVSRVLYPIFYVLGNFALLPFFFFSS
jgi:hypothetical protein